ncbi:MAG: hypothetical protein RMM58_09620 [Chloroflexota bacterium]|nr:hypothetical protein [Dehalococcoidia bacterium]MDW8254126.1 hypothetical protein [Chloroflexota bacterium]
MRMFGRLARLPLLGLALGMVAFTAFAPAGPPSGRPTPVRAHPPTAIADVIIPTAWANDAAIELAVTDLRSALAEVFGLPARLRADDMPSPLPFSLLLLAPGVPFYEQLVSAGQLSPLPLSKDGYRLLRMNYRGTPMIAIIGGSIRGTAYGAFRFVEMIRLNPDSYTRPLNLKVEPAIALRLVSSPTGENYPSPEDALRWGYNTVAITQWPWLLTFDSVDPAIYAAPEDRAWVEQQRARARAEIARAKALHLDVLTSGDVISFPARVAELYGEQVGVRGERPIYCLNRPRTQQLYRAGLRELLRTFPEIDIVMIRTGENYPAGPVSGNPPAMKECGAADMPTMLRLVMEISYQEIVEIGRRRYIQRAWDIGADGFHADPAVAGRILEGVGAKPGLLVSFKHTQTDFWRHNPANPNINRFPAARMVEYQAAREYEGKGAFPNYLGGIVAGGAPESGRQGGLRALVDQGVTAVWVWARGGGWNGPYLRSHIWLEANNYALAKLVWDPSLSPKTLALQWATLRFGPKAAPHVARVLELSEEVVLRTFYVAPFARWQGPWAPNVAWTRDDVIFGADRVGALYQQAKTPAAFEEALREKEIARRLLREMVAEMERAADLSSDPELADEAINTVRYGDTLLTAMTNYVSGMFYYFRWVDLGRVHENDRQAAFRHLAAWRAGWSAFNEHVLQLYGVATGYTDHGMVQAVEDALADLNSLALRR